LRSFGRPKDQTISSLISILVETGRRIVVEGSASWRASLLIVPTKKFLLICLPSGRN